MLTGDRIVPRPAETAPRAEPSRIEEIGTRLAHLYWEHNELDKLIVGIARNEDLESNCAAKDAEQAKARIWRSSPRRLQWSSEEPRKSF